MPGTRVRTAVAVATVGSLLCAGSVGAAPKKRPAPKPVPPVCNLITDDEKDASVVTSQPMMDIVSGDLATDAKNITAVLRLASEPKGGNPEAAGGARYYVAFSVPGAANEQFLYASVSVTGTATFRSGEKVPSGTNTTYTNDAEPVTGSIKGNILTISAPLSTFAGRAAIKPGMKLGLSAETFALVGVLLVPADDAAGKAYIAGTPSCVKPGVV